MKVLKYILIFLVVIVAIVLILGLILPKEYSIARSTVIAAPRPVVLAHIKSLKTMDKWNPWSKRDPNIKQEFGGTDGEVGSWLKWESEVREVGKGKQEVMAVNDNAVDLQLTIDGWKPADVNFTLADTGDATKVTWTLNGKIPYPFNAFGLFMNMDKMIGPDFEKGLAGLKIMSEEAAKSQPAAGYEIKEINFEPKVYLAKRATVKTNEISSFFQKNMPNLFTDAAKAGLRPAGAPSGIYFTWDTLKHQTDMAAAVAVAPAKTIPKIKGMEQVKVEGKALYLAYHGAYDKFADAYEAIHNYLKVKNMSWNNLTVEEYITDPMTEKDTAKWQTNIYYFVK